MREGYKDESEHQDKAPFLRKLKDADIISGTPIEYFEGRPDKLVRIWPLSETTAELEASLQSFKRGIRVFRQLEEKYGIAIPKMDMVVGEEEGVVKMFTVVDKIYGTDLYDLDSIDKETVKKFDEFFTALARHYFEVFEKGGDYWTDLNSGQIIYGHKAEEKQDRVYVVDVDPRFDHYDNQNQSGLIPLDELFKLLKIVKDMEIYSEPPVRFSLVRKTVDESLGLTLRSKQSPYVVMMIRKIKNLL